MLQFCLLKYLKFDEIINLLQTCKNAGTLCDANIWKDELKLEEKKAGYNSYG